MPFLRLNLFAGGGSTSEGGGAGAESLGQAGRCAKQAWGQPGATAVVKRRVGDVTTAPEFESFRIMAFTESRQDV